LKFNGESVKDLYYLKRGVYKFTGIPEEKPFGINNENARYAGDESKMQTQEVETYLTRFFHGNMILEVTEPFEANIIYLSSSVVYTVTQINCINSETFTDGDIEFRAYPRSKYPGHDSYTNHFWIWRRSPVTLKPMYVLKSNETIYYEIVGINTADGNDATDLSIPLQYIALVNPLPGNNFERDEIITFTTAPVLEITYSASHGTTDNQPVSQMFEDPSTHAELQAIFNPGGEYSDTDNYPWIQVNTNINKEVVKFTLTRRTAETSPRDFDLYGIRMNDGSEELIKNYTDISYTDNKYIDNSLDIQGYTGFKIYIKATNRGADSVGNQYVEISSITFD